MIASRRILLMYYSAMSPTLAPIFAGRPDFYMSLFTCAGTDNCNVLIPASTCKPAPAPQFDVRCPASSTATQCYTGLSGPPGVNEYYNTLYGPESHSFGLSPQGLPCLPRRRVQFILQTLQYLRLPFSEF